MATPPTLTTKDILQQLQKLTQGLYYQSEADYPLEVISLAITTNELTQETVLTLASKTPGEPVEVMEPAVFFRHLTPANPASEQEANAATSSQALQAFLEQNLQDTKVFKIGRRTISSLLVGKTNAGNWIGLKTTVVET